MAPEPSHLAKIRKNCLHCNSTDVKFMYFNNHKSSQPRYKCRGCNHFFTHGGKCRARRVARQPRARTTSTAVVVADLSAGTPGPAARRGGRPPRSQNATPQSGTRRIHQTRAVSSRARSDARTTAAPTRARTDGRTGAAARTVARPTIGALGLPLVRIPETEHPESPVQSPATLATPVVSSVLSPAIQVPVRFARPALLVPGEVVDVDQRPASRTAATVIAQGEASTENPNWMKAVLGVCPYGLVPASNVDASNGEKRMKVMKIKCDGKVFVAGPFWA